MSPERTPGSARPSWPPRSSPGLRERGVDVRALKPIITGLDERASDEWPHDHEILATVAGCPPDKVVVAAYGPPASPHLALELTGRRLDPGHIVSAVRRAGSEAQTLVVEGVGGLLVPIAPGYDVRRLAADLGLPLIIAARPGLGTINHTLLTLEAARAADLQHHRRGADALARGAERDRALQPRDDRRARPRPGRDASLHRQRDTRSC